MPRPANGRAPEALHGRARQTAHAREGPKFRSSECARLHMDGHIDPSRGHRICPRGSGVRSAPHGPYRPEPRTSHLPSGLRSALGSTWTAISTRASDITSALGAPECARLHMDGHIDPSLGHHICPRGSGVRSAPDGRPYRPQRGHQICRWAPRIVASSATQQPQGLRARHRPTDEARLCSRTKRARPHARPAGATNPLHRAMCPLLIRARRASERATPPPAPPETPPPAGAPGPLTRPGSRS